MLLSGTVSAFKKKSTLRDSTETGKQEPKLEYVELKDTMSKVRIEKEGNIDIDERVSKLRTKILTEEMIRQEVEKRRRKMR
jgi:hypothetical protein